MHKDKYVTYHEIPRRDHSPETTIYLWRINDPGRKNQVVINDVRKALLNFRLRKRAELARSSVAGLADHLGEDVGAARRVRTTIDRMEHATVQLSEMLRLFTC
jgi:hypothetical protein